MYRINFWITNLALIATAAALGSSGLGAKAGTGYRSAQNAQAVEEENDPKTFGVTITDQAAAVVAQTTPLQTTILGIVGASIVSAGVLTGMAANILFKNKLGDLGGGDDGGDGGTTSGYGAPSTSGYGAPSTGYGTPSTGYGSRSGEYNPVNPVNPANPANNEFAPRMGIADYHYEQPSPVYNGYVRSKRDTRGPNKAFLMARRTQEMFDLMTMSDPAHCYKRLICDLGTGESELTSTPILNLLDDSIEHEINTHLAPASRSFRFELLFAKKFGMTTKSIEQCERAFECPYTGMQLDKLINAVTTQQNLDGTLPSKIVVTDF